MIQISPSILNAYLDLLSDDSPWMTQEKFRTQLLQLEPMSPVADAGNAAHDAAFDHSLVDFPTGNYLERVTSGGTWWVDPALVLAIREAVPGFGTGLAEVPRLVTEDELGIKGVRLSMRADYLEAVITNELKTTSRVRAKKYLESGQRWAYLVAYNVPVRFVLAQVKTLTPRGRPDHVKGAIVLDRIEVHHVERHEDDLARLQEIVHKCHRYLSAFPEMIEFLERKPAPGLL